MLSCLRKYTKNTDTSGYRTEKLPALLSEVQESLIDAKALQVTVIKRFEAKARSSIAMTLVNSLITLIVSRIIPFVVFLLVGFGYFWLQFIFAQLIQFGDTAILYTLHYGRPKYV